MERSVQGQKSTLCIRTLIYEPVRLERGKFGLNQSLIDIHLSPPPTHFYLPLFNSVTKKKITSRKQLEGHLPLLAPSPIYACKQTINKLYTAHGIDSGPITSIRQHCTEFLVP